MAKKVKNQVTHKKNDETIYRVIFYIAIFAAVMLCSKSIVINPCLTPDYQDAYGDMKAYKWECPEKKTDYSDNNININNINNNTLECIVKYPIFRRPPLSHVLVKKIIKMAEGEGTLILSDVEYRVCGGRHFDFEEAMQTWKTESTCVLHDFYFNFEYFFPKNDKDVCRSDYCIDIQTRLK